MEIREIDRAAILGVFKRVLGEITPTRAEIAKAQRVYERVKVAIESAAAREGIPVDFVELEGSTGIKQTQLRDSADLDVFVGFDLSACGFREGQKKQEVRKAARKLFSGMIDSWLKRALGEAGVEHLITSYAEHPYVSGVMDGLDLDVVLCFNLSLEELMERGPVTSVDRTPWHSRFIRDNLSAEQKGQVRLFKQFCKAQHSYGDKAAPGRSGFIGYALELLVHHYGDLLTIFEDFNDLPNRAHDPRDRPLRFFKNHRRFQRDLLVVVDPTDVMRNVGASISRRSYFYVAKRVKEFLASPSPEFFEVRPIPLESSRAYPGGFYVCEFEGKEGVHYTVPRDKVHAIGESLARSARLLDGRDSYFPGVVPEVYFEEAQNRYALGLYCPVPNLPGVVLREGPLDSEEKGVRKFRAKHPDAFLKGDRWVVEVPRAVTSFAEYLREYIPKRAKRHEKHLSVVEDPTGTFSPLSDVGRRVVTVLKEMVLPFSADDAPNPDVGQ
ncbi:MAG: hypothetical protein ACTSU5_17735 [Promethearchaeota archaeon]